MPIKKNYEDFKDDEFLSPEEAQAKIIQMLLRVSNPSIMTELTEQEVRILSALQTIASEYKVKSLHTLITNYMLLKVSFKRQGRKEIIQVAKPDQSSEEKLRKGLKSMVLGLK